MTEWNPQIVRIEKVIKHPNADSLSIATVLGDYPVIFNHTDGNDLHVGDLAAYLPIDTVVPNKPYYGFLAPEYPAGALPDRKRLIKAKKIRGIFSMGMLVRGFQYKNDQIGFIEGVCPTDRLYSEGESITDTFSLSKKLEVFDDEPRGFVTVRGKTITCPWSVPHYDLESFRKHARSFQEDEFIVVEEKLHGCNAMYFHDGEQLWVKSRNFFKERSETDLWWSVAIRYNLEEKLKQVPFQAVFGEIVGQNPKFPYDRKDQGCTFHVFDIFDVKWQQWLDWEARVRMLAEVGLQSVPLLYAGLYGAEGYTYDQLKELAEGNSLLNSDHIREGFVIRTMMERSDPYLGSRTIAKFVGEGYNLQK